MPVNTFSLGTTEKTVIEVLTTRSNAQRQLIAKAYEKATGRVRKLSTINYDCGIEDLNKILVGRVSLSSSLLHQTLKDDIEGDTHGDFEDLLVALITPPAVYDCQEIITAIKVRLSFCHTNTKM